MRVTFAHWHVPAALVLVAALWEVYKAVGPDDGGKVVGIRLLPRTSDRAMPHVWDMLVAPRPTPRYAAATETDLGVVAAATWFSFRVALAGFVIGAVLGHRRWRC